MTHNQAVYYRLLLENGHPEELTKHIDHALETENPLSDLTLDLSLCFSDKEKLLTVLGNHICRVNSSEIDWNGAIFNMVLSFLRSKSDTLSTEELVLLMKNLAENEDLHTDDRWFSMYIAHQDFDECASGYGNMNDFTKNLRTFLQTGTPLPLPRPEPKKSFWKKICNRLRRRT